LKKEDLIANKVKVKRRTKILNTGDSEGEARVRKVSDAQVKSVPAAVARKGDTTYYKASSHHARGAQKI
jgi:hypothetical protein